MYKIKVLRVLLQGAIVGKKWIIKIGAVGLIMLLSITSYSEKIILVGWAVIDVYNFGKSHRDIKDTVVIIEGGKITAVGRKNVIQIPNDAQIIDIQGKYVLPELIDGHAALDNQVIAAATWNFSEIFKWKETGQIKPGCRADILATKRNPLDGIKNLKEIDMIMLKGKILNRGRLLQIESRK